MSNTSSLAVRLVPIVAAGLAIGGVFFIVTLPGDVDDLVEMAVAGQVTTDRLKPTFDGRDIGRRKLPVDLQRVATGLAQITDFQAIPGQRERVVVLQKTGAASLLDLRTGEHERWFGLKVNSRSEMGLLGIAFAQDFPQSGVFYTHHNPSSGDRGLITRWTVDPALQSPPQQGPTILDVAQPYSNHDGGQLQVGPDGLLYVALGDGGAGFDPEGHGQNGKSLLGTILRIRPKLDGGYAIPEDNPFLDNEDVHDAIFAYGLRNPWRFDFDATGRIVTGDVGQGEQEEVDLVPRGGNLGWANVEGKNCLKAPCEGFVDPIWTYGRDDGNSVTGGVVAQTSGIARLDGKYLVGDFGSGRLWALDLPAQAGESAGEAWALGNFALQPSTFGVDANGRIYVGDFSRGTVYKVVPHVAMPEARPIE